MVTTTHRAEPVMGTVVSFDVRTPGDHTGAIDAACAWLHDVDAMFSPFRPDSAISRIGRGELALDAAPDDVRMALAACDDLERTTAGVFTAWPNGRLDPSGYVKGWAAERASQILVEHGALDHVVNAGGDVRVRGRSGHGGGWRVAIAHPCVRDACCTIVAIDRGAVATSGTAERGAHVVDGRTGAPATALASVTVAADDLTSADVVATIALALGLDARAWLLALDGCEAYVVDAHGFEWATPRFPFAPDAPQAHRT